MGTTVRFERPRQLISKHPHTKDAQNRNKGGQGARTALEHETREASRSLLILTSAFLVTATVMCGAVVAAVSSTWSDVIIMSAFVLVFALLKIVLANALIYTMLRYDAATANIPVRAGAGRGYQRFSSIRKAPAIKVRGRGSLKIIKPRTATGNAQPGSS